MKINKFLTILCACNFALYAKSEKANKIIKESDKKIFQIIKAFKKQNPRILSSQKKFQALDVKLAKSFMSKDIINASYSLIEQKFQAGVGISSAIIKDIVLKFADVKLEIIKELTEHEKLITEYLEIVSDYSIKKNQLQELEKILESRKKDLNEYSAKAKIGMTNKKDESEFAASVAGNEIELQRLQDELELLKNKIDIYNNKQIDLTLLTIEDLEGFANIANYSEFQSSEIISANIEMKKSNKKAMLSSAGLISFGVKFQGSYKTDSSTNPWEKKAEIQINLPISESLDLAEDILNKESQKLILQWQTTKSAIELKDSQIKLRNSKNSLDNSNKELKAAKVNLQSASEENKHGSTDYNTITNARAKYYDAVKNNSKAKQEYAKALIDFTKKSGVIFAILLDDAKLIV